MVNMKQRSGNYIFVLFLLFSLVISLTGCSSEESSDLLKEWEELEKEIDKKVDNSVKKRVKDGQAQSIDEVFYQLIQVRHEQKQELERFIQEQEKVINKMPLIPLYLELTGDVEIKDETIEIRGVTNLVPGAKIRVSIESSAHIYTGINESDNVQEDGTFVISFPNPKFTNPVKLILRFNPEDQNYDIKKRYRDDGLDLVGPYIHTEHKDNGSRKVLQSIALVNFTDVGKSLKVEAPAWDFPKDQGEPKIWMDAELEYQGNYIIVSGKSNLIEGSFVKGSLSSSSHTLFGYQDQAYVNPDGSFLLVIQNAGEDVKGKMINIDLSLNSSLKNVKELYGAKGEHLQGEFIKEYSDGERYAHTEITVTKDVE